MTEFAALDVACGTPEFFFFSLLSGCFPCCLSFLKTAGQPLECTLRGGHQCLSGTGTAVVLLLLASDELPVYGKAAVSDA